jgi:hypothetical protein
MCGCTTAFENPSKKIVRLVAGFAMFDLNLNESQPQADVPNQLET